MREANDRFGWSNCIGGTLRTETDLPELASLNELARRVRLITKKSRKVSLTARGRRALGDTSLLWCSVVAEVFSGGTCQGQGAAVAAATLVQARNPVPRSTVQALVRAALVVDRPQVKVRRTSSGRALMPRATSVCSRTSSAGLNMTMTGRTGRGC